MLEQQVSARGIRFSIEMEGMEVGHAYLYLMTNDLHDKPFGLLEDVQVDDQYKGQGIGNELVRAVLSTAKREGCYKLLATSRNDGTREAVHSWYERLGFKKYGTEFRMDF